MFAKIASSLQTTSRRAVPLRKRDDLTVDRIEFSDGPGFIISNPLSLTYVNLEPEQYRTLDLLNGERSLEDIRVLLAHEFPSRNLTLASVQALVTDLHQQGLVTSSKYGQGQVLVDRHNKRWWQQFWQGVRNILSLRLPGWNPDRLLLAMLPWTRWIYHPVTVSILTLIVVSQWLVIAFEFREFRRRLPEMESFFAWPNWLWLWITLAGTKVVHEFGHGLTCRYYGAACREMGVMLLVLSPTLYCDVSDSWRLKSKWQRIAIGAAGMAIESVLSTIALFIWWNTQPGLVHYLCLNVFFVTTISTVIFNANPLLRYDGYYMLADFLGIPNLRSKADRLLQRAFATLCLGIELPPDPLEPKRGRPWFILFTIASSLYSWFVQFSILWFLYGWLKPYELQSLGAALAAFSIGNIIWGLVYQVYKIFTTPRQYPMKKLRWMISATVFCGLVAAVLLMPVPWYVEATTLTEPVDAQPVHVLVPGQLSKLLVKPGEFVEKGALLAVLENKELVDQQLELIKKREALIPEERALNVLQKFEEQLPAKKRLETVEAQLRELDEQARKLEIRAPATGYVIAGPSQQRTSTEQNERHLATWSDSPLARANIGAYFDTGTHLLSIAPRLKWQAVLYINQSDRDDVKQGQPVWLKFDHLPLDTVKSEIAEISTENAEFVPPALSNKQGGTLATVTDREGHERLYEMAYRAIVPIPTKDDLAPRGTVSAGDNAAAHGDRSSSSDHAATSVRASDFRTGLRGAARVMVVERTLGGWLWRWFLRTLHFRV